MRRHIWGYSVCLCPIRRMPAGLHGLIHQSFVIRLYTHLRGGVYVGQEHFGCPESVWFYKLFEYLPPVEFIAIYDGAKS